MMLAFSVFVNTLRDFLANRLPLPLPPQPVPDPEHSAPFIVDHMRRELDQTKADLARTADELARLHDRCRILERSLKAKDADIDRLRRDRDRERDRRRSDANLVASVYNNSNNNNGNVHPHRHPVHNNSTNSITSNQRDRSSSSLSLSSSAAAPESDAHSAASASASAILDEDRARAKSTDVYLTRTDTWSGAQVLQAVHDINSEILQFAAAATEVAFDRIPRPTTASSARVPQAIQDTAGRIGPQFTRILAGRDHSQDPLLVQLALQGCLTLCITRALSVFCVGFPSKSDALLHQIYHRMALAEPQPTSSKWRALTHQHIHAMYPSLAEYSINELTDTILRWSADVFLVAGCHTYELSPSSQHQNGPGLRSRFTDHVRQISKSVIRLAKATREEILSTSFELIAIDPTSSSISSSHNHHHSTSLSTTLKGNASTTSTTATIANNNSSSNGSSFSGPIFHDRTMIDAFGEYGHSRGLVLATTELGLRCVTRMGAREGVGSDEEVLLEQRILLMPKVVLESVLDVLDR